MKSILVIFLTSIFTLSCGDDFLNITGITETEETSPEPIGNVDEDDWCSFNQEGWALWPAFPNPASETVTVTYDIATSFWVKLQVINNKNKVVQVLREDNMALGEDAKQSPGRHKVEWNLDDKNGRRVKAGFYRVQFFLDGVFKCHGDIQVPG